MMSRLDEALFNAREAAVEERAKENGPSYMSELEGYGDLVRKLERTRAITKAFGKELERFSGVMDMDDPKMLHDVLTSMEQKAASAAYDALRMYAGVRTMMETVRERTGGNLLDYIDNRGGQGNGQG